MRRSYWIDLVVEGPLNPLSESRFFSASCISKVRCFGVNLARARGMILRAAPVPWNASVYSQPRK